MSNYIDTPSEALVSKLHALEALLLNTCGDAHETFLSLRGDLIDSYLDHCSELATECKALAHQVNELAHAGQPVTQEG